jgi:hypothetical protein
MLQILDEPIRHAVILKLDFYICYITFTPQLVFSLKTFFSSNRVKNSNSFRFWWYVSKFLIICFQKSWTTTFWVEFNSFLRTGFKCFDFKNFVSYEFKCLKKFAKTTTFDNEYYMNDWLNITRVLIAIYEYVL